MQEKSSLVIAIKWIKGLLNRLTIPHQIAGGLAAKCFGSSRPLHDIDIYVPGSTLKKLETELQAYIEFGPAHYCDEHWELTFMKLNYKGQQIELADADDARYFNSVKNQWVEADIDFTQSVIIKFRGIKLPIMPKKDLIEYKQGLNRTVDQIDVREILGEKL
ncbi:MAG: hypothetical protein PVH63_12775 [Balneolaceae bacterium]|jgi:hypothetical protein